MRLVSLISPIPPRITCLGALVPVLISHACGPSGNYLVNHHITLSECCKISYGRYLHKDISNKMKGQTWEKPQS